MQRVAAAAVSVRGTRRKYSFEVLRNGSDDDLVEIKSLPPYCHDKVCKVTFFPEPAYFRFVDLLVIPITEECEPVLLLHKLAVVSL